MAERTTYRLGDLQLQIMKVLWRSGPLSVAEVQEALVDQDLAYTTIATMLRKMEDRGLVRHHESNRKFIYQAVVAVEEVTRSAADDLVERLFEGRLADAVSHLLETRDVSVEELTRLEQMIRQRRARNP